MVHSVQFCSVAQSCLTICNPMNHSTPGLPVHHQLPEFTQTHGHRVGDAIQPSHPLSSPSPPTLNPSQHQSLPMSQLFAWGGQSTGVSALASFLPKISQGWSPSEWIGWISLQSKGLSRVFSNITVQKHQFFSAQNVLLLLLVGNSCLTLWNPMDCSLPGSSDHWILQARILEWVAIPYSRSSWPRNQTHIFCVFCIASGFFTVLSHHGSPTYYTMLIIETWHEAYGNALYYLCNFSVNLKLF